MRVSPEITGNPDIAKHGEETRWAPGQSGNPKGRPKGRTLKNILKDYLDQEVLYKDLDGQKKMLKVRDAIGLALIAKALVDKDIKAIEMIRLETEGPRDREPQILMDVSEAQKEIVSRAMARMLPSLKTVQDSRPVIID